MTEMAAYSCCNSVNTVVYACPLERCIIKWAYSCKRCIQVWQIVTEVKRSVSKNCSEIQTGSPLIRCTDSSNANGTMKVQKLFTLTLNSDSSPAHYTLFVLSFTFNSQLTETCCMHGSCLLSGISLVSTNWTGTLVWMLQNYFWKMFSCRRDATANKNACWMCTKCVHVDLASHSGLKGRESGIVFWNYTDRCMQQHWGYICWASFM